MLHKDDGSAVTFWLPKSGERREKVAKAFERMAHIFRTAGKQPPEGSIQVTKQAEQNKMSATNTYIRGTNNGYIQDSGQVSMDLYIGNTSLKIHFCPRTDDYEEPILLAYRCWYSWMVGSGMDIKIIYRVKDVVVALLKEHKANRLKAIDKYIPQSLEAILERTKDQDEKCTLPIFRTLQLITQCYDAEVYL